MYFLILKEIEARESSEWDSVPDYVKKQKNFLEFHVGMWVPEFTDNIEKNTETQFYKNLSRATRSFMPIEKKWLMHEHLSLTCLQTPDKVYK